MSKLRDLFGRIPAPVKKAFRHLVAVGAIALLDRKVTQEEWVEFGKAAQDLAAAIRAAKKGE